MPTPGSRGNRPGRAGTRQEPPHPVPRGQTEGQKAAPPGKVEDRRHLRIGVERPLRLQQARGRADQPAPGVMHRRQAARAVEPERQSPRAVPEHGEPPRQPGEERVRILALGQRDRPVVEPQPVGRHHPADQQRHCRTRAVPQRHQRHLRRRLHMPAGEFGHMTAFGIRQGRRAQDPLFWKGAEIDACAHRGKSPGRVGVAPSLGGWPLRGQRSRPSTLSAPDKGPRCAKPPRDGQERCELPMRYGDPISVIIPTYNRARSIAPRGGVGPGADLPRDRADRGRRLLHRRDRLHRRGSRGPRRPRPPAAPAGKRRRRPCPHRRRRRRAPRPHRLPGQRRQLAARQASDADAPLCRPARGLRRRLRPRDHLWPRRRGQRQEVRPPPRRLRPRPGAQGGKRRSVGPFRARQHHDAADGADEKGRVPGGGRLRRRACATTRTGTSTSASAGSGRWASPRRRWRSSPTAPTGSPRTAAPTSSRSW